MKKELTFNYEIFEEKYYYTIKCNEDILVKIPYDTLVLNSKEVYEKIFKHISVEMNINLENIISSTENLEVRKKGKRIYDILVKLFNEIETEINSIDEENSKVEKSIENE